ncbi:MAG: hypothetical protein H6Q25_727 [Bacteroidetes bacterium]|nr:hypothetical protein [Bacteroidota bacterium]
MKKILIFIFVIIFCNINAQNVTTSLREEILNGKIKIIKQKIYMEDKVDTMLYIFNDLGLLIEEIQFRVHTFYFYNSNNQKIKSISNYLEYGGIESHTNEYFYEDGTLIKHILKYPPSTDTITRFFDYFVTYYKYDFNNQLIEVRKFNKHKKNKTETFSEHYKYQYDSCGNKTIEEKFDSNGNKLEIIEKKYMNNILLETNTWMKFEGEDLYLKTIYLYDDNGNLESQIEIVYMYGSKTDIVTQSTTSYFYDDQQRLIKVIEPWHPNNKITTYSDFDINDNWLQKIIIDNNGKVKKYTREIEYFNE